MDYKEKLRNKKLKHKLDYIKLELEETLMIFQESLVSFQTDFTEYLDDWDSPKKNLKRVGDNIKTLIKDLSRDRDGDYKKEILELQKLYKRNFIELQVKLSEFRRKNT